ncbi:sigma-70 family RNA polymerase sigma factor [Streptomyces sp. NPDC101115]|uniref:sigma-70 family RNA polymerase sigma factor n=1 Tax=Streptomyces sp. NPDC101115 TaxID=3366106 RepID=UPI00382F5D8A
MSDVGTEESGTTGLPSQPVALPGWAATSDPGYWDFHAREYGRFFRFARWDLGSDELAEAAVETTFTELMCQWSTVRMRPNPTAYAWTVLKRRIIDQGRRRKRTALPVDDPTLWTLLDKRNALYDPCEELTMRLAVRNAVRRLPERQRDVITLYFLLDQPTAVVAKVLDMEDATVRSHINRALPRLARFLDLPIKRSGHGKATSS